MTYIISTYYKFFPFPDYFEYRGQIKDFMNEHEILGNILIASEGINATVCGSREAINTMYAFYKTLPIGEFEYKESSSGHQAFRRVKVRLKKELISLGRPANAMGEVGEYLDAADWNALISNPDTIILDTRNDYELEHGTFEGAVNPNVEDFKQLPEFIERHYGDKKDVPMATFCTGGIRCEKLTAYLKAEGYEKVYHLKGGIIKYLQDTTEETSKWRGKCFVFDDRIAVGHEEVKDHTNQS